MEETVSWVLVAIVLALIAAVPSLPEPYRGALRRFAAAVGHAFRGDRW